MRKAIIQILLGVGAAIKLLKKDNREHSRFLDNMVVGLAHCEMIFDEAGHPVDFIYKYVNPAFERLTGLQNVIGKKISEIIPELRKLNPEIFELYGRVALGGPPEATKIFIQKFQKWFSIKAFYFEKKNHFAVVFDNITKEKLDEEALRISEERFRFMIEQSPLSIQILDTEGKTIKISKSFEKLWGLTIEDLKNYNMLQDKQLERLGLAPYIRRSFAGEATVLPLREYDATDTLGKGFKRVIGSTTYPIKDFQGNVRNVILIHEDVTERERAKVAIIEAKEAAEHTARIKSRFLDMAAHELRTPVTAFSLLLQVTQRQLENGLPVEISTLARLRAQADRISNLVIDLLDVSRLERGIMKLKLELKDINSVIEECVADFKLIEPSRSIVFFKPEKHIDVNIDKVRITQVITNILENARKYTPINTPIEITVETKPGFVRISIIDHGPGISEQQQAMLFTPFARGPTEQTSRFGGLGLGLYISSKIIKLHGGTIGVISKVDIGSTFYFELPTL